jgi:hypothetical protein
VYALLSLVYNHTIFITLIIANRVLEGGAFGLIQGAVYGISSQELSSAQFDRFARMCSATSAAGCCLSLFISSLLFSFGGYFLPYFMLSGSIIALTFIIYVSGALKEEVKRNYD